MSRETRTYVWDHARATGSRLNVLLYLAERANKEGACWPSLKTICQRVRIGERSTQDHLSALEATGEIFTLINGASDRCNKYLVTVGLDFEQISAVLVEQFRMTDAQARHTAKQILTARSSEDKTCQRVRNIAAEGCGIVRRKPAKKTAKGAESCSEGCGILQDKGAVSCSAYKEEPSIEPSRNRQVLADEDKSSPPSVEILPSKVEPETTTTTEPETPPAPSSKARPKEPKDKPAPIPLDHPLRVALAKAVGMDSPLTTGGALTQLAKETQHLFRTGTTPETVAAASAHWYANDWRGQQGDVPRLKDFIAYLAIFIAKQDPNHPANIAKANHGKPASNFTQRVPATPARGLGVISEFAPGVRSTRGRQYPAHRPTDTAH